MPIQITDHQFDGKFATATASEPVAIITKVSTKVPLDTRMFGKAATEGPDVRTYPFSSHTKRASSASCEH